MNSNTAIEICLGGTHLHRHTEALQHLANTETQNVQANNLLLRSGAHQLELRWILSLLLGREHAVVHGCEPGVVDLDVVVAVALASFRFRETDGADFGVGEDDGGDVIVGELIIRAIVGSEEAVAEQAAGGNGDYRILLVKQQYQSQGE